MLPLLTPIRRPSRPLALALIVAMTMALAACGTRRVAPVEERSAPPRTSAPGATVPGSKPAPAAEPDWRPQTYTVKRGDTLYQIALDHGLDYRELAAWNNIDNVNLIRVGQVLRLAAAAEAGGTTDTVSGVVTAPLRAPPPVTESRTGPAPAPAGAAGATATPSAALARNNESLKTAPKAVKEPYSPQAARDLARAEPPLMLARAEPASPPSAPPERAAPMLPPSTSTPAAATAGPAPPSSDDDDTLDWIWPAKGKIVSGFSDTASLKGVDIAGTAGQPVIASAPGKVVYAGSGLRGYGKLVIIKHNKTFLSAYAHNREILVKEGQQVTRGQKIAEMGNTDADQVKLHFEIRRLGKPMDPVKYLPPA